MQGHRRRRATQRSPATSISPKGGGGTAAISLSLLLHDVTDIASSSLRELDAVALAPQTSPSLWNEALSLVLSCFRAFVFLGKHDITNDPSCLIFSSSFPQNRARFPQEM